MVGETVEPPRTEIVAAWQHTAILLVVDEQKPCIVNNPNSPIAAEADYQAEAITGPESVTRSTRMKAGTSQKLIFDMISTTVQIRITSVEGNKMVNAKLINNKLIDRAVRIFMERNPQYTDYEEAKALILKAGSVKKAEEQKL